jgi:hypothetical protein
MQVGNSEGKSKRDIDITIDCISGDIEERYTERKRDRFMAGWFTEANVFADLLPLSLCHMYCLFFGVKIID